MRVRVRTCVYVCVSVAVWLCMTVCVTAVRVTMSVFVRACVHVCGSGGSVTGSCSSRRQRHSPLLLAAIGAGALLHRQASGAGVSVTSGTAEALRC